MDIDPLANALWAQRFSNKSTQLSAFAPAKCPTKAMLTAALPNPLITTGLAHLSSLLLLRCDRLNHWSQFFFIPPRIHTLVIACWWVACTSHLRLWSHPHDLLWPAAVNRQPQCASSKPGVLGDLTHMVPVTVLYPCHNLDQNMPRTVLWSKGEGQMCAAELGPRFSRRKQRSSNSHRPLRMKSSCQKVLGWWVIWHFWNSNCLMY